MSKVTNECQAASAKSCNAHCDDYECPKNAGGVCRAPNPCLGYEEAAKLLAELEAAKRELAKSRAGGDAAAHLEDGLRAIMALTEPSAHALDLLGTVHRTAKECLRQTPPIATAEKSSAVGDAAKLREAIDKCVNLITEFGNAEIVKTPLDVIIDIEAILKVALSEPPRNCERFATADDAKREFNYLWNFVWQRGGGCLDERNYEEEFERWLFAHATEKEGGEDGSK